MNLANATPDAFDLQCIGEVDWDKKVWAKAKKVFLNPSNLQEETVFDFQEVCIFHMFLPSFCPTFILP